MRYVRRRLTKKTVADTNMVFDSGTERIPNATTNVFVNSAPVIANLCATQERYPSDNYRDIFDANPDPICITLLSNWRIVLVNQEFERATGHLKHDAFGK